MSPEAFFIVTLLVRMLIAGLFVISATIAAERAGPFIGGLIVTLPVSAGPAYLFLSLDHDAAFVSASALSSLVNNIVTSGFAVLFILLSQRLSALVSVVLSLAFWLATTVLLSQVEWTGATAMLGNVAVFFVCYVLSRPYAHAPMPRMELRFFDFLLRAVLVAGLVAAVVGLSFAIGPAATGILAVFPITFTSIMLILHRRVGAAATGAVLAQSLPGLIGFALATLVLHLAAVPLGKPAALTLALACAMAWNCTLFATRRLVTVRA